MPPATPVWGLMGLLPSSRLQKNSHALNSTHLPNEWRDRQICPRACPHFIHEAQSPFGHRERPVAAYGHCSCFRWLRRRKWVVARVPQVECTVIKDSTGAEIAGEWDVYAFGVVVSMTTRQRHRNIETSSRSASTTERCSTPPTPCRRPVDSTWA